jgi:hypothetical protein
MKDFSAKRSAGFKDQTVDVADSDVNDEDEIPF